MSTPSPAVQAVALPIVIAEQERPWARVVAATAWGLAVAASAVPLVSVAAHAIAEDGIGAVVRNPIGGIQIALGAVLCGALAVMAARAVARIRQARTWIVDQPGVRQIEHGRSDELGRLIPMQRYSGLTHVVRTSLMGTAHELVLVGERAADDVVVRRAERIGALETAAVAGALGVPELPARALIDRAPRQTEAALPLAQAA